MLNTKRLEKLIVQRKLSKKDVLAKCSITRPTLDKILKGGDFNVSTLEALAHGLDVSIAYLFEEDEANVNLSQASTGGIAFSGDNNSGNLNACGNEGRIKDLENLIAQLRSQLNDKERIIKLMER